MNEKDAQGENLDPKIESHELPINKGDEFMRLRKVKKEINPEPEELVPKGGRKMNIAIVLIISAMLTVGGTLLGFIFGWFANAYYTNLLETIRSVGEEEVEEEYEITPHPEMMDKEGNLMPFQMAKLISVEFTPSDAFDMDPFPDSDDD
jgi:hypothetical protein